MMAGEIGLNGEIHAISGILPIIIQGEGGKVPVSVLFHMRISGKRHLIPDMKVIGVRNLQEMIRYVQSTGFL